MVIKNIGLADFNKLVERETKLRDDSPEHTLDWYTYNNKVVLLEEVRALFAPEVKSPEKKETTESEEVKKEIPKKKKVVKDKIPTADEAKVQVEDKESEK